MKVLSFREVSVPLPRNVYFTNEYEHQREVQIAIDVSLKGDSSFPFLNIVL